MNINYCVKTTKEKTSDFGYRLFLLHVKHTFFHLFSPLKKGKGFIHVCFFCTQAKLFITKGLVFDITVILKCACDCFCQ